MIFTKDYIVALFSIKRLLLLKKPGVNASKQMTFSNPAYFTKPDHIHRKRKFTEDTNQMFNKLEHSDRQICFGLFKRQPQKGSNYFLLDITKRTLLWF